MTIEIPKKSCIIHFEKDDVHTFDVGSTLFENILNFGVYGDKYEYEIRPNSMSADHMKIYSREDIQLVKNILHDLSRCSDLVVIEK